MSRRRVRDPRAGFTLIEVLIALIVFAIGVLGLAIVIPLGTRKIGKAGQQTRASSLAAECAENLLTTPYGDGDLTAGTHLDPNNPIDGRYYVRWTVTDNTPQTDCKKVLITVARGSPTGTGVVTLTIVSPRSGG